ncbi:uncharacterized protein G2W53_019655 [Senna tora]|uniref:Uncharacterized protein n=1 Tax=Senna tora TaxID=362788 RepID=A0A834TY62_9FABA|nr:uncharacterized protein G2W53_019655 [Senna tora]
MKELMEKSNKSIPNSKGKISKQWLQVRENRESLRRFHRSPIEKLKKKFVEMDALKGKARSLHGRPPFSSSSSPPSVVVVLELRRELKKKKKDDNLLLLHPDLLRLLNLPSSFLGGLGFDTSFLAWVASISTIYTLNLQTISAPIL